MSKREITPEEMALLHEEVVSVELSLIQWAAVRASIQQTVRGLLEEDEPESAENFALVDRIISATVEIDGEGFRFRKDKGL